MIRTLNIDCKHNKPFKMKFENIEYRKVLYKKIENIKSLDRAIFNIHLKMNSMFDAEHENIKENKENKETNVEQLTQLYDLKNKWEKELMCMYFEEED
mgnify:CR=1 FL=1|jgi:hypothetical protein